MSIILAIGILFLPGIFAWFTLRKGYSTLSRILAFACLFLFLLIPLVGRFLGADDTVSPQVTASPAVNGTMDSAQNPTDTKPTLFDQLSFSDKELSLIKHMTYEDFKVFSENGGSLITRNDISDLPLVTNANEIQLEYERNEVAGDKKFLGKRLIVNGIVKSIDRSIGKNYFISFVGGSNSFIEPHAKMADGYTDYLAELAKGQKIGLICRGDGMLGGSAMVTDCEPVEKWLSESTERMIESFHSTAGDETYVAMTAMVTKLLILELKENSVCYQEGSFDACKLEIKAISKNMKKLDDDETKQMLKRTFGENWVYLEKLFNDFKAKSKTK